ncbi:YdeI/OmpD-associated family protein [Gordonia sp. (in: high G+C Gram-positive bacteria)]|uniref:YdeI/OmpD-associated family protein n=1 Tax=Gordonia sp. (in: high G+C Gram-positive bacteria) TaxID=84139 RepID=UPI003C74C882
MTTPDRILAFDDGAQWEGWLERNHATAPDAWLQIAKSGSTVGGISIGEALDGALCFGWIDGQRRSRDGESYLQRYSPRRPTSSWSKINVDKFEALVSAGRVRPAGIAAAEQAKADGRWSAAYESQASAQTPAYLLAALSAEPAAAAAFESLNRSARYAVILPLLKARSAARRAALVARVVEGLAARTRPTKG